MNARQRFAITLARIVAGSQFANKLATVSVRIDDSPGWSYFGRQPHDRDYADMQQSYVDALDAWRKNPLAWRATQITTDYVVGQRITITSPEPNIQRFIDLFWNHHQNRITLRLETMCEELTRAGDLFVLLFRNPMDGMSYIRFLTKDQIKQIDTLASDWETETTYHQIQDATIETKKWYAPGHGRAHRSRAVCLHYSVNRPIGAQFGESDLATVIPWLLRYSRMLEGRIRLHWAARAFLWFVTVPTQKVAVKQEQYQSPPEPGSVIVKDDAEEWEIKTPNLRGADAQHDLQAARHMIDAGTGFPPHWRGESTDVNLATAQAMQEPTERHLARRQRYFVFILEDLIYQAYLRANDLYPEQWPVPAETNYQKLFRAATPDISRSDNTLLAQAAKDFTALLTELNVQYPRSKTLRRLLLELSLKFAGEPPDEETLDAIIAEAGEPAPPVAPVPSSNGANLEGAYQPGRR